MRLAIGLAIILLYTAALGGLSACDLSGPDVLLVPDRYPSPQAAVDAAEPGDKVWIRPGVYTETRQFFPDSLEFPTGVTAVVYMKPEVEVRGLGDPGEVVFLNTAEDTTGFGVVSAEGTRDTRLVNITVRGFHTGVLVFRGQNEVRNCVVEGGIVGIYAFSSPGESGAEPSQGPLVVDNIIQSVAFDGILNQLSSGTYRGNRVRHCGAGMGVEFEGTAVLEENLFCSNRLGLVANVDPQVLATRNVFAYNTEIGVILNAEAVVELGGNDFFGNALDIEVGFYDRPLKEPVDAGGSYWGTTDPEAIRGPRILDADDDPRRAGTVAILPLSSEPLFPLSRELLEWCGEPNPQGF